MCGIAGYAGRPKKEKENIFRTFMDNLLVETQSRGSHATGVAAFMGGTRSVIGKGPVDAANFIKAPVWERALEGKSMIAHCRYATHGSPGKNENNHPFESGRWAMIHNGIISEYREICRKEGVSMTSECDSEVILRVFAKHTGKNDDNARRGLQSWVDALGPRSYSRYAVALLDRTNGVIRLLRNDGSPCSILRIPALGIVAFASTKEILARAFDATFKEYPTAELEVGVEQWECARERIYILSPETLEVEHEDVKVPEMEFKSSGQGYLGFRSTKKTGYDGWAGSTPTTHSTFEGGVEIIQTCPGCGQGLSECECRMRVE